MNCFEFFPERFFPFCIIPIHIYSSIKFFQNKAILLILIWRFIVDFLSKFNSCIYTCERPAFVWIQMAFCAAFQVDIIRNNCSAEVTIIFKRNKCLWCNNMAEFW